MKRVASFIVMLLLGAMYSWMGLILVLIPLLNSATTKPIHLVFGVLVHTAILWAIVYSILYRKNSVPIYGLTFGIVIGFFL